MKQYSNGVCEEKHKSIDDRFSRVENDIKDLKNIYETINKTILAVNETVIETKHIREDVNKIVSRLDVLESIPGKRYEQIIMYIAVAIIGGIITFIFTYLGLR